jgi:hypothetical protein
MKFAHVIAVGLMAAVAVGGVSEAQAGGMHRHHPKPKIEWFKISTPFQPGYSTGSETGGTVQFGMCRNLGGAQQAGSAADDGSCLPAESLAGAVMGYVDAVDASCTVGQQIVTKHHGTKTLWSKTISGQECGSHSGPKPMGN